MKDYFWSKVKNHLMWRLVKTGALDWLSDETFLKFKFRYYLARN